MISEKKHPGEWFWEEKSMQRNSWEKQYPTLKKYQSWRIMLKKNLTPVISRGKKNSRGLGKKYYLPGGVQNKSFAFQDWKYAHKRHKWEEKVRWNAQFPFCGQTKAFRHEIGCLSKKNSTLFCSTGRIVAPGLFWTNQGSKEKLEVHSVLYGQGKYVLSDIVILWNT